MKSVAWYKHLMKKYHSYGSLSPGVLEIKAERFGLFRAVKEEYFDDVGCIFPASWVLKWYYPIQL